MVNMKKVFGLLSEMGNVGDRIGKSKNWGEMANLVDEVMAITTVEWDKLGEEAKEGDMDDLKAFIKGKLDLADDDLEKVVEKGLSIAVDLADMIMTLLKK